MRNEFTAIIEQDEGWFIAYSPEVPGANGQGRTKDEALKSLSSAIFSLTVFSPTILNPAILDSAILDSAIFGPAIFSPAIFDLAIAVPLPLLLIQRCFTKYHKRSIILNRFLDIQFRNIYLNNNIFFL